MEQFLHAFASRGFVSVSWAFLYFITFTNTTLALLVTNYDLVVNANTPINQ